MRSPKVEDKQVCSSKFVKNKFVVKSLLKGKLNLSVKQDYHVREQDLVCDISLQLVVMAMALPYESFETYQSHPRKSKCFVGPLHRVF